MSTPFSSDWIVAELRGRRPADATHRVQDAGLEVDQRAARGELGRRRLRDEEPVVIYHSHTSTEAHPSRTDIAYASEPGAHYVLVSTREEIASRSEFRSFLIIDGVVTEEEVVLI